MAKRLTTKSLRALILQESRKIRRGSTKKRSLRESRGIPRLASILFEQDDEEKGKDDAAPKEGGDEKGLVDINAGPDAVLAAASKLDPAILKAGTTDAAGPEDEVFEIVSDNVPASSLSPTQSQVEAGQE